MELLKNNKTLLFFLIGLCFLNLIQGGFTELLADEAYYWTYSNFLSWGYFDHPPMVALWIRISKLFFSNGELNVRFVSAITLSATIYLIWKLIKHPQKKKFTWLFIITVLSTALFNVYGFITVPDTPLLFFAAIFLLGYQKYLDTKSLESYLLITIGTTGMMYSKYQGILIILFVLISNIKILKDPKIWGTAIGSLILFSPHLYWQFLNDFPSFRYHLSERVSQKYQLDSTTNHFLNLIAIIGFTFPVVYYAFYKRFKIKNTFEKALRYIVVGFTIFFFIASFKNHVQAQWVVPISIPLIIITFYYLIEHQKHIKVFKILAFTTIGIILIARVLMIFPILPIQLEMHGNKAWVNRIDKKIKNTTPLFLNSYQNASTYWFYSKKRPYAYNYYNSRKNQYDLYTYNQKIDVKNTFHIIGIGKYGNPTDSVLKKNSSKIYLKKIDNGFKEDKNVNVNFIATTKIFVKENQTNSIKVNIKNPNKIALTEVNLKILIRDHQKKQRKIIPIRTITDNQLIFDCPKLSENFKTGTVQVIGRFTKSLPYRRMGFSVTYNIMK